MKIGCGPALDIGTSWGIPRIAASIGGFLPRSVWAWGFALYRVDVLGENEAMKSTSPALNAAISVTGSLMTDDDAVR